VANLNELLIGLDYAKQVDIATLSAAPLTWRIANLNKKPWGQKPINETDATEIGKGHEFATALYKSHYDNGTYSLERYVCSELAAFALGYGLGKCVKSGTTPNWIYTCTPLVPATDGLEPPYFRFIQQLRPGASSVLDQVFTGCAVKSWKIALKNEPGRASAMLTMDLVHSGLYTEPSAVTLAAQPTWSEMRSASLALTINGVDYVAAKTWVSLETGWENNFRPGWLPGSTAVDGYATQGRFEVGDRVPTFSFVVRYQHGSTELATLRALTTGTAVVGLQSGTDVNNALTLTWEKTAFTVAELADENGIVTIGVTVIPMFDPTNSLFSAVVKCTTTGICQ
jgi:hypothetical protein